MHRRVASASVALNILLAGAIVWHLSKEGTDTPEAARSSKVTPPSTLPDASRPPGADTGSVRGRSEATKVIAMLRDAQASPDILYAVANAMLAKEYGKRRAEMLDPNGDRRWRRSYPETSPEVQEQLRRLQASFHEDLRALMGPDYEAAISIRSSASGRYGSLSAEKAAIVARIESDYSQMRTDPAMRRSGLSLLEIGPLLDTEKERDLAEVLSPEELADYLAFNSGFADQLQGRLRKASIDDRQYRQIYDAAADYRAHFYSQPGNSSVPDQSAAYRLGETEALRAVASDDVLAAMAMQQDAGFQRALVAIEGDKRSGREILDKYHEYLRFFAEMDSIQPRSKSREETYRLGKPAADRAYRAFTEGLSPAQLGQFDKTKFGQILAPFRLPPKE